ncbi:MAG TPA: IS110 family transposase [Terracidiphilus sp.]|jgi:transposase
MMIIGCDFHPRFQQIAFVDQETGEYGELRLNHPEEAERFYRSVVGRPVRIGAEATGNFRWFRHLMEELGYEFLLGDATAIRAACPRRQKTDKRDARHILNMLVEDRFPVVWQPPVENDDLRQLLMHRCRLVRMRTRVKNQLDSMAKNEGVLSSRVWSPKRRQEIEALPLPGWYGQRRSDLLGLLGELDERIKPLDKAVCEAAEENPEARLLMTHPGVGPIVSLAYVLTIGDWRRFPRGKQVGSYLGLIPAEESSGNSRRLGHISKQGSTLLRWLLVEAAVHAQRHDPSWHRQYVRLSMNKHHGVAKVAIAHKLAVRLYWMLRSGDDYNKVMERGSHAGQSV